jgi:hypothetical protein
VVALSQVASGICAAFVGPLIAGITLGHALMPRGVGDEAGGQGRQQAGHAADGHQQADVLRLPVMLAGVCLAITLTTLLLWFSQKTSVVALSQVASGMQSAQ